MEISTNWLKDYVDLKDINLDDLAVKLTKSGINVEEVIKNKLNNLVIGEVLSCEKIIDSDHLSLCKVDIGKDKIQIVCGAPNVRKGLKVIVALEGAILPNNFVIKKSIIKGYESNGMLCAMYELGLEEKTKENYDKGITELENNAKVGEDVVEYLALDDILYKLDLNPNRNIDCTNHIGFAYEVASVLGKKVTMPSILTKPIKDNINNYFNLKVDTANCYLYYAKMVKDVKVGEAPDFIKNRLKSAGMRSINNVVDISNYVMLEYGQPLHFFDKNKLGNKIVVRMATPNEKIVTLDEKERVLSNEDIVITDSEKPVCLAGVMGGLNTDVTEDSKDILIEAAIFNPLNIRYTSINLDLRSEASVRYERGLNYEYTYLAIERACHLLEKYASGKVLEGTVVYDHIKKDKKVAAVTKNEVNSLLGMELTNNDIEEKLTNLGFPYTKDKDTYTVTIPNRRLDVESHSSDLIEEIGRLYGYEKINSYLPVTSTKRGEYKGKVEYIKLIKDRLQSLGLDEVNTYTLISNEEDKIFDYTDKKRIALLKPMSLDKAIIRRSIIPSLLKVIDYNKARNAKDIMIYELANVYYDEEIEETKIAIALNGNYLDNNWNNIKVTNDFYLAKGIVENILNYLGYKNRFNFIPSTVSSLHPGISADIILDKENVGFVGKVHPSIRKDDVFVIEMSLNKIINKIVKPIKHKESSKYPSIIKDMAFIVNTDIIAEDIQKEIKKVGGRLVTDVNVFDIYIKNEKEKSIAYSITFSDNTKTLNDEEIMVIFNNIIVAVEKKFNAILRNK